MDADHQPTAVARQMGLVFEIVPVVADGATVPCPGFYQSGAAAELLPLSGALRSVYASKIATPTKARFVMAATTVSVPRIGWLLTIDRATGLNPPLAATELLVSMSNTTSSTKGVYAIDGRACSPTGTNALVLDAGKSGTMRLSSATTTTLVLRRPTQDIAVFAEPNFWTMFGGRRLTIDWLER